METKTKIGILYYVATSGAKGIKFEDEKDVWYNPNSQEARDMVRGEFQGKKVKIILAKDLNKFSSIELVDQEQTKKQKTTIEKAKEEEVPHTPPEEEKNDSEGDIEIIDIESLGDELTYDFKKRDFTSEYDVEKLLSMKLKTEKKGSQNLTYASWAEVWGELKKIHPTAEFHVFENKTTGMPYVSDKAGAFVKVGVKIAGIEHICHLPVMDHFNKSVAEEKLDTFIINKSIQRALVKACAMHGLGLYVYQGEDYPEEQK